MADLGLMGMTVPVEFGGAGADDSMLAVIDRSRRCLTAFQVHNSLVCGGLRRSTARRKERWLRPLAKGRMLGCFA